MVIELVPKPETTEYSYGIQTFHHLTFISPTVNHGHFNH